MSHEIRTPMTAILGYAEQLQSEDILEVPPEDRHEAIATIHRNGHYLLKLINNILDLSKIEASKLEIERLTCNTSKLIIDISRLMRVQAEKNGITLEMSIDGGIPETILSDPIRLQQILINLIDNAIKFTESGTVRLVVSFEQNNEGMQYLRFDVIDTGIGMNENQIDRLFDAFTQADTSITRKYGGTGLGLAISKRLAHMLGGDITVSSTPGHGSAFSLTVETGPITGVPFVQVLPGIDQQIEAINKKDNNKPDNLDCRILLAEDVLVNQKIISVILEKVGANITTVDNGKAAYEEAVSAWKANNPYDVILMDMQMPIMDGYTATRKLRHVGYDGAIIALTAHAMAGDRDKCLESGCDNYATKPVDRKKLIETIRQYLSSPVESSM